MNTAWGKKYFNGETLKTSETMVMLKQRLQLAPVKNTKLIAITVYSDDKRSYPYYSEVQITDPAEPGHAPVKPNKTLNIVFPHRQADSQNGRHRDVT